MLPGVACGMRDACDQFGCRCTCFATRAVQRSTTSGGLVVGGGHSEQMGTNMKPPFIRTGDSHPRSIAKAISWRITGSIDTFVLSFIFTGSTKLAASIAAAEMVTKMVLYYLHERAWSAIRWNQRGQVGSRSNSNRGTGA